jgi:hypothetical protein
VQFFVFLQNPKRGLSKIRRMNVPCIPVACAA